MRQKFSLLIALALICVALYTASTFDPSHAQSPSVWQSGKFYKFDRVAKVGEDNITSLEHMPTINDFGTVAFVGKSTAIPSTFVVNQLFARDLTGPVRPVTAAQPNAPFDYRLFSDAKINNSSKVLAGLETHPPVGTGTLHEVRLWDGNAMESSILVVNGIPGGLTRIRHGVYS